MVDPSSTPAAHENRDTWSKVTLGLITVGICALAPFAAYVVLYRCKVPEIQTAIDDDKTRAVLFLYITIGTVFTACWSSFLGSVSAIVSGSRINLRRIIATLQCIASLGVIIFFFMLGPPKHKIDLSAFVTTSKEFVFFLPNHYLTYVRGILASFSLVTIIFDLCERFRKQKS